MGLAMWILFHHSTLLGHILCWIKKIIRFFLTTFTDILFGFPLVLLEFFNCVILLLQSGAIVTPLHISKLSQSIALFLSPTDATFEFRSIHSFLILSFLGLQAFISCYIVCNIGLHQSQYPHLSYSNSMDVLQFAP